MENNENTNIENAEVTEVQEETSTEKIATNTSETTDVDPDKVDIDPTSIDDLSSDAVNNVIDEDDEDAPDMDAINKEIDHQAERASTIDTPIPEKNGSHAGLVPQKEVTEDTSSNANQGDDGVVDGINTNMTLQDADRQHREIGVDTAPVGEAVNAVSSDDKEVEIWRTLHRYFVSNQIIYGRISGVHEFTGVKMDKDGNSVLDKNNNPIKEKKFAVVVMVPAFPDMPVYVKEDDFWLDEDTFGSTYDALKDSDKLTRRENVVQSMIDARIPLLITEAKRFRHPSTDRVDKLQPLYGYVITASRKKAMDLLMHIWFFRSDFKRRINTEDVYRANVLRVDQNSALVECCGVQTYITAYNLTGRKLVKNCADEVQPGDCLNVKITKCYVHHKGEKIEGNVHFKNDGTYPFDWVYLTVSGRAYDSRYASRALMAMNVGDTYTGYVVSHNFDKHLYSIVLNNNVPASVREDRVIGTRRLAIGQKVTFKCERKRDNFVIGRAMKYGR